MAVGNRLGPHESRHALWITLRMKGLPASLSSNGLRGETNATQ
jgi:hypothetical protein